jgi:hypothetical protein
MPAILRSVYNYKKATKSPRDAIILFANEEQLAYMRQLMRTGVKQHWPSYDHTSKGIIKNGLAHMDKFLEKTGRPISPTFSSILKDI